MHTRNMGKREGPPKPASREEVDGDDLVFRSATILVFGLCTRPRQIRSEVGKRVSTFVRILSRQENRYGVEYKRRVPGTYVVIPNLSALAKMQPNFRPLLESITNNKIDSASTRRVHYVTQYEKLINRQ